MTRNVIVIVVLSSLLLAGCGKYGKPTRHDPRDRDAEKQYTLPVSPR